MNWTTVALALLAWKALSANTKTEKKNPSSPLKNIAQFVNDDTKNILDCVEKLTGKNSTQEDKTGAVFQIITNPAVMNIASALFKQGNDTSSVVNDEGYEFEKPSQQSRDFFKPIDNIADAEVKHKLYWFYDNWYVK